MTHGTQDFGAAQGPVQVALAPGEVMVISWELADGQRPDGVVRDAESYALLAGKPFTDELSFKVKAPEATGRPCLRLGVCSDDLLAARGLKVRVNGHGTSVRWQDAPRGVGDPPGTWWIEVPLQSDWIQPQNDVELLGDGAVYRLMFASLVVRGAPPVPGPPRPGTAP